MKGKNLSEIKTEYKFPIYQKENIWEARNWMLTKYKNFSFNSSIEMVNGRPQYFVILTSEEK